MQCAAKQDFKSIDRLLLSTNLEHKSQEYLVSILRTTWTYKEHLTNWKHALHLVEQMIMNQDEDSKLDRQVILRGLLK